MKGKLGINTPFQRLEEESGERQDSPSIVERFRGTLEHFGRRKDLLLIPHSTVAPGNDPQQMDSYHLTFSNTINVTEQVVSKFYKVGGRGEGRGLVLLSYSLFPRSLFKSGDGGQAICLLGCSNICDVGRSCRKSAYLCLLS